VAAFDLRRLAIQQPCALVHPR